MSGAGMTCLHLTEHYLTILHGYGIGFSTSSLPGHTWLDISSYSGAWVTSTKDDVGGYSYPISSTEDYIQKYSN